MILTIKEAQELSNRILLNMGFKESDVQLITKNLIDAELAGHRTHGLVRLPVIKKNIDEGKASVTHSDIELIKDQDNFLLINSKHKPAIIPIYQSLDRAIPKAKKHGIVTVGIQDAQYCSGYIGSYARYVTQEDLIFIAFNNSPDGLIPHGSKIPFWGTNPLTIGVPTHSKPVVLDMASTKIAYGNILLAHHEGTELPDNTALDNEGKVTKDPKKVISGGGLLPFAGHKGSGLALIIELLAGALTGSRVGFSVEGGWGTSYILIDPTIFRPLKDFKDDVQAGLEELKNAPKAEGVEQIYFPGEQSAQNIDRNTQKNEITVSESIYANLKTML